MDNHDGDEMRLSFWEMEIEPRKAPIQQDKQGSSSIPRPSNASFSNSFTSGDDVSDGRIKSGMVKGHKLKYIQSKLGFKVQKDADDVPSQDTLGRVRTRSRAQTLASVISSFTRIGRRTNVMRPANAQKNAARNKKLRLLPSGIRNSSVNLLSVERSVTEDEPVETEPCDHKEKNSSDCCRFCFETRYAPVRSLVDAIVTNLEKDFIKPEINGNGKNACFSIFQASRKSSVSLHDFLFRCVRYTDRYFVSPPGVGSIGATTLLLGYIYMNKFLDVTGCILTEANIHRILAVCLFLACNTISSSNLIEAQGSVDGEAMPLSYWSRVVGVQSNILGLLQTSFINKVANKFELDTFDDQVESLRAEVL